MAPTLAASPFARQTALLLAAVFAPSLAAQEPGGQTTVELHGSVLLNGFRNGARVNNSDVPTVVLVPDGGRAGSLGGAIRQTRLTATVRREEALGGRFVGELDVDFFGGQQPSSGGRTHPIPRLRRAYGELRWSHVSLLVGQEAPPIVEVNPSSIASIGFPLFAASGNLWLWLPQIRLTAWTGQSGGARLGFEGAVLAPSAGDPQDPFLTQPDRAEKSGEPAFEGRILLRWTAAGRPGTVSFGGHYGRFVGADESLVSTRMVALAVTAPLGGLFEVRGEAFRGQGIAGLGGGGIGQLTDESGSLPLHTEGGWGQLLFFPARPLELGIGFGVDDPRDSQLSSAGARTRNSTFAVSGTARTSPFVAGIEIRRTRTTYLGPPSASHANVHVNLGIGFEF